MLELSIALEIGRLPEQGDLFRLLLGPSKEEKRPVCVGSFAKVGWKLWRSGNTVCVRGQLTTHTSSTCRRDCTPTSFFRVMTRLSKGFRV